MSESIQRPKVCPQKIEGQEIVAPDVPEATGVVDLMEALRASVEATKEKKAV